MKYLFLVILCWAVGFALPYFTTLVQLVAASIAVGVLVAAVYYYIDTRINAIRL